MESIVRVNDEIMDKIEAAMQVADNPIECSVIHRFTDKMYIREIFMPQGTLLTSRTHRFESPFVISQGTVAVNIDGQGWVIYKAPYTGITKAGTRRLLYIIEDCIWTTFHVNEDNEREIKTLENRYTFMDNPLLTNKNELLCPS
jgi:hypothetical protein